MLNSTNLNLSVRIVIRHFITYLLATCFAFGVSIVSHAQQTNPSVAKRVVLVHGLARSSLSMWYLQTRLEVAGFDVVSLDYDSLNHSPEEVQRQVDQQIKACCDDGIATHYVGYSLGGLLIRGFFANPKNLRFALSRAQVVMIGTPNNGTQVVDKFSDERWFQLLGDTTLALGTDSNSFPMGLPLPDFAAGIIAGTNSWALADDILGEESDGLVPVKSTQLPNMADFIKVYANHSMLRYNGQVAEQTLYFLNYGYFDKSVATPSKSVSAI